MDDLPKEYADLVEAVRALLRQHGTVSCDEPISVSSPGVRVCEGEHVFGLELQDGTPVTLSLHITP